MFCICWASLHKHVHIINKNWSTFPSWDSVSVSPWSQCQFFVTWTKSILRIVVHQLISLHSPPADHMHSKKITPKSQWCGPFLSCSWGIVSHTFYRKSFTLKFRNFTSPNQSQVIVYFIATFMAEKRYWFVSNCNARSPHPRGRAVFEEQSKWNGSSCCSSWCHTCRRSLFQLSPGSGSTSVHRDTTPDAGCTCTDTAATSL